LGNLALSTAVGVGTGGLGGVVEEVASRAINRTAGSAIERGASSAASRLVSAEAAGGAAMSARVIGSRLGGAGIAGGVINAGFSVVDQVGAYSRGEVTASQAVGTVTGEAADGVGAGVAGAAAGAAIGSVIPVAGTAVGAVIGFGVGVAAGYLADKGLRSLGVDKAIAHGVTAAIDGASDFVGGTVNTLKGVFGW
jgi:hypothetical protein